MITDVLNGLYFISGSEKLERMSKYVEHLGELKFGRIEFPVQLTDINKFEKLNQNILINVYGWDKGPYPLYVSEKEGRENIIDLLLLSDGEKIHYVWVKDLGTLVCRNNKTHHKQQVCRRCLHVFSRADLLEKHRPECLGIGDKAQRTEMPHPGKDTLTFANYANQMRVPYVIYADFETLNVKVDSPQSTTQKISDQPPCGFCYIHYSLVITYLVRANVRL